MPRPPAAVTLAILILAACTLTPAVLFAAGGKPVPSDCTGTWEQVSITQDGVQYPIQRGDRLQIRLTGNRWVVSGVGPNGKRETIVLHAECVTRDGKSYIRAFEKSERDPKKEMFCLFRVRGDEMDMCGRDDDELARVFSAPAGSGRILIRCKRLP